MKSLVLIVPIVLLITGRVCSQTTIDDIPASVVVPVIHLQKVNLPAIAEYDDLVERYQELLGSPGIDTKAIDTKAASALAHWSLLYAATLPAEPDRSSHLGMMWSRVVSLAKQGRWKEAKRFKAEASEWLDPTPENP